MRGSKPSVLRERRTPFVEIFRTTPAQTVCPNFFVLSHANGCGFRPLCRYCYLQASFWYLDRPHVFSNLDDMMAEIRQWIDRDDTESVVLNAGNLSDSLSFEGVRPVAADLVELFRERAEKPRRPQTLLLVTKGGRRECRAFLESEPCASIVLSFSVNHPDAAARFEAGAAPPDERLAAAGELLRAGWRVRLRIDPMIRGYDYVPLARQIRDLGPERVTLGTLRAEPSLFKFIPNGVLKDLVPSTDPKGLARYPAGERVALYRSVLEALGDVCTVGLCEETPEVWDAAGLDRTVALCNCAE